MKFVQYLLDTKAELKNPCDSGAHTVVRLRRGRRRAALQWEQEVTKQITALMDLAVKQNDYLAQSFLQWFIDEQLEEVVKMDRLLSVIRQSGEKNLLDGRSLPGAHRKGRRQGLAAPSFPKRELSPGSNRIPHAGVNSGSHDTVRHRACGRRRPGRRARARRSGRVRRTVPPPARRRLPLRPAHDRLGGGGRRRHAGSVPGGDA